MVISCIIDYMISVIFMYNRFYIHIIDYMACKVDYTRSLLSCKIDFTYHRIDYTYVKSIIEEAYMDFISF